MGMWNIPRKKMINFGGDRSVQGSPQGRQKCEEKIGVFATVREMGPLLGRVFGAL